MNKKFKINRAKIKAGCRFVRKVVTQDSKRDLPLAGPRSMYRKWVAKHSHDYSCVGQYDHFLAV